MTFPIQRKSGVVTARRQMFWQVLNHKTLEPKLAKVSLLSAGIYGWIRIMAGNGHFDGTLWWGEVERMKVKDLVDFIARRIGGEDWQKHQEPAKQIMTELRDANLLIWGKDRIVYAVNFAAEQFKPQTPGAKRQRSFRARQSGRNADVEQDHPGEPSEPGDGRPAASAPGDNVPPTAAPSAPPPPPPPASTSIPTDSTSTQTKSRIGFGAETPEKDDKQGVTRDAQYRRVEKRDYRPFEFDSTRPAGGGGGGGRPGGDATVDVYAGDPVATACRLTGENGPFAVNGFRAALGRVGESTFRAAMGQFRSAKDGGVTPRTRRDGTPGTWGAMLQGYIRANEEGRGG